MNHARATFLRRLWSSSCHALHASAERQGRRVGTAAGLHLQLTKNKPTLIPVLKWVLAPSVHLHPQSTNWGLIGKKHRK